MKIEIFSWWHKVIYTIVKDKKKSGNNQLIIWNYIEGCYYSLVDKNDLFPPILM